MRGPTDAPAKPKPKAQSTNKIIRIVQSIVLSSDVFDLRHRAAELTSTFPTSHVIDARAFFARAAPIAVLTSFSSSGGGKTAGIPSESIQSSRVQPVVW